MVCTPRGSARAARGLDSENLFEKTECGHLRWSELPDCPPPQTERSIKRHVVPECGGVDELPQ